MKSNGGGHSQIDSMEMPQTDLFLFELPVEVMLESFLGIIFFCGVARSHKH